MVDYVNLALVAETLIAANGRTVQFFDKSTVPLDPSKPWRGSTGSDAGISPKAVVVPYEEREIDGTSIKRGDKRMYVAHNSVSGNDLEDFDYVLDGATMYSIQSMNVINPGDLRLLYDVQVRQ